MLEYGFSLTLICDALRDLVPFAQFKICRSVTLIKLQVEACNFIKSNTPSWVFFTFLKLHKMVPNRATHHTLPHNDRILSCIFYAVRVLMIKVYFFQISNYVQVQCNENDPPVNLHIVLIYLYDICSYRRRNFHINFTTHQALSHLCLSKKKN